jgi:hypothetical protein
MINFLGFGNQIGIDENCPREFAFFDTTTNKFLEFGGKQVWDSWNNFLESGFVGQYFIDRLKPLCPDWVFNKELSGGK